MGDFRGPLYVFTNIFLKTFFAPDACMQASGRFVSTILCVHKAVCEDTVVHQMLVYKRLGDFRGPLYVFTNIFVQMHVEPRCAHGQDAAT